MSPRISSTPGSSSTNDKSIPKTATYYTLDEIASMIKSAPLKLSDAVERLRSQGYKASMTSLNPGGFRTDCEIDKITQIFRD